MSFVASLKQIKNKLFSPSNNAIIHNKFILYFLLFLSLADLLILSVEQDMVSICLFILIGLLTTYFSKNMLIVLFIALTFTNIIKYGTKLRSEGFTEGAKNKTPEDETTEDETPEDETTEDETTEDETSEDEKKENKKDSKKKKEKFENLKPPTTTPKPDMGDTMKEAVGLLAKFADMAKQTQ